MSSSASHNPVLGGAPATTLAYTGSALFLPVLASVVLLLVGLAVLVAARRVDALPIRTM